MMLIPEAWAGNPLMDGKRRAFYEYHARLMEPWDGPAAMAFTDGRQIGATLDRNGLRPARYLVTERRPRRDGLRDRACCRSPRKSIVHEMAAAAGQDAAHRSRPRAGIISDDEIKAELASAHPYQQWLDRTQIRVQELPDAPQQAQPRTNVRAARPAAGVRLHAGETSTS